MDLTTAIVDNETNKVKYLLKRRYNPNVCYGKRTALDLAILGGNEKIIELLVQYGVEIPDMSERPDDVRAKFDSSKKIQELLGYI